MDDVLATLADQLPNVAREAKNRGKKFPLASSVGVVKSKGNKDGSNSVRQTDPPAPCDTSHTPSRSNCPVVEPSSEAARLLRQAQQRRRKEQWKRNFVGVAQEEGIKSSEEAEKPEVGLLAEVGMSEMELLSNG